MPTSVTDKLSAVITEIDARGNADLLRLTVLMKWFERPGRLARPLQETTRFERIAGGLVLALDSQVAIAHFEVR